VCRRENYHQLKATMIDTRPGRMPNGRSFAHTRPGLPPNYKYKPRCMFARVKRIRQSWVRDRIIISIGFGPFGACERASTHTHTHTHTHTGRTCRPPGEHQSFQRHIIRPCCRCAATPDCLFRVLIIAPLIGPITSTEQHYATSVLINYFCHQWI
jgi:hypothetical protein